MKSAKGAKGPIKAAIQVQTLHDLPRSEAMREDSGIEAIDAS
ncbi:MAG TPA: hypothetical protein VKR55_29025 [Bradyrhizobium sp.]|nr:hypothetical protein [Bradyrhizobium sp.]HLZ06180.1 hypothetical protein [Bradyrhizobium sp.]